MTNWESWAQPAKKISRWTDDLTGLRFYGIPSKTNGLIGVPGATSILSFCAPSNEKARLEAWRKKEIKQGRNPDAAAKRGTMVHECLEQYIRGFKPTFPNEEIESFYSGMEETLDDFDEFIWSERPLKDGYEHTWNTDDKDDPERLARVWSYMLGAAGTPDFIGKRKRKYILVDWKSSTRPYHYPDPGVPVGFGDAIGYKKMMKTIRQLSIYDRGILETLDLQIDEFWVCVGMPGSTQLIKVRASDIERARHITLENSKYFWELYADLVRRSTTEQQSKTLIQLEPSISAAL